MSPERRHWLSFIATTKGDLDALAHAALERLGDADAIVLTREEKRDVASLIALCEHASELGQRVRLSLSNEAVEEEG